MTALWSLAATHGFSVFPLRPNGKRPPFEFEWGPYGDAPAAPSLVDQWASRPSSNMAVATGAVSGCFVLDCDNLLARVAVESRGVPDTFTVATPRGTHFYFSHPGWPISNKADGDGSQWSGIAGLDIRGDGGYVVGPGSYFIPTADEQAKGKVEGAYAIERDLPLAPAPDWLLELLWPKTVTPTVPAQSAEETSPYGRKVLQEEIAALIDCPAGSISHTIYRTVARLAELVAGGEIREDEGWGAIEEALLTMGLADEAKANGTVHRAWEKGCSNPKAPERQEPIDLTERLGTRALSELGDVPPPPVEVHFLGPNRIGGIVGGNEILDYFKGVVLVTNRNEMFLPSGVLVSPAKFDSIYGGARFVADADGKKVIKGAWEMFTKNEHVLMPRVWETCFRPELPPGAIVSLEGLTYLNTYVPIRTPRRPGDPSPFVNHVRKMLPNGEDADILLHWMASAVQNPGKKFFWWPVVQGAKGLGKSMLLTVMTRAIGERYSHMVNADSVLKTGNQFNDWIVGKLFLGFGEIRSSNGKHDFVEIMKDTVTDERMATEGKGVKQTTSDNRANGMMLSNWKDGCPIDPDERRWAVFYAAQQTVEDLARDGMTGEYFPNLFDWLKDGGYEIVTHFLATMPLEARLDPAGQCHRAPVTSSTAEAIQESRGMFEQEVINAIDEGHRGFSQEVISSIALRALADKMRRAIPQQRFAGILESLGYVKHPALAANKGRANNALRDGSKPVLYFWRNGSILMMDDGTKIKDAVEMALFGEEPSGSNVVPIRR